MPVGTAEVIFRSANERFGVSWRRRRPDWLTTDARHGNSILKQGQQVFTFAQMEENREEKCGKVLEMGANSLYVYG